MIKAAHAIPNKGRIIVKEHPPEKELIVDPNAKNEKPRRATVVAVGKPLPGEEMMSKVGGDVVIGKYAGMEVNYEDGPHVIMFESDVLAFE